MTMKKNILLAALLLIAFYGCGGDSRLDNPAIDGNPDYLENHVAPEVQPLADAMTVELKGKTFAFDGDYHCEGRALLARATNRAAELIDEDSELPNEDVENIILPNERIKKLWNSELASMIMVLSKGGAIVVTDPTIDQLKALVSDLRGIITMYLESGNNVTARYVMRMLNMETIDRILMWTDNFDYSVYLDEKGKGDYLSLAIFRQDNSYIAYREAEQLTDYQYGQKADRAAEWMNTQESDAEKAESRKAAARMMATRAGGDAEQYVDKIAKSLDFTYDMGLQVNGPQGYSRYHNCTLTYKIWTAYSKEKNCDVYCVTQTVTAYNQNLNCGPKDERDWYNGKNWGPWKSLDNEVSGLRSDVYGPYMKKIYTKCELKDGSNGITLTNYAPQNSTSGGQNESNGFSFGLGANASVNANGPQVGINASMSWSHSVSSFNADLSMTASPSANGVTEWTYNGRDVDSHFSKTPWKNHYHEFPRQIQVTTCTVEQAWVWTVAGSQSQTVTIQPTFLLQDDWLTYDRAISHIGQAYAHHISTGKTRTVTPIVINCPPRHIQTWSMSVSTDADGADVTKIKNYLTDQLKQYFLASSVFYTIKPDHKKAYNEGKKIEEYDEIGRFVYVTKEAFTHNSSVMEILKEAGMVGGVPNTGSYRIVWRQTDSDVNSDSEDFTFNMQ